MIQKGPFIALPASVLCFFKPCRATEISVVPNSNKCLQYPPDGALGKRTDSHLGGKVLESSAPRSMFFLFLEFLAGKRSKVMIYWQTPPVFSREVNEHI